MQKPDVPIINYENRLSFDFQSLINRDKIILVDITVPISGIALENLLRQVAIWWGTKFDYLSIALDIEQGSGKWMLCVTG